MATVLIVDDEKNLTDSLEYVFKREGIQVFIATSGYEAVEAARHSHPDVIILDLMLPDLSGFEVCRRVRRESGVPIIMLTARDTEVDKVAGLEMGADDYVTKPFSVRELVARVRAHLRRAESTPAASAAAPTVIAAGDLVINPTSYEVFRDNEPVALQPREFELLVFLARHPDQVFNREQILEHVWGANAFVDARTVDVHIRWLRKKIEADPAQPRHLETVRGVGYRFRKAE